MSFDLKKRLQRTTLAANPCHCRLPPRSQRDYLLGKIKEVEQKLSASKGVRQATERERKLASAANKLKVCAARMHVDAPVSLLCLQASAAVVAFPPNLQPPTKAYSRLLQPVTHRWYDVTA